MHTHTHTHTQCVCVCVRERESDRERDRRSLGLISSVSSASDSRMETYSNLVLMYAYYNICV